MQDTRELSRKGLDDIEFSKRLIAVKEEIEKRVSNTEEQNKNHFRSRLWNKWIVKNIATPEYELSLYSKKRYFDVEDNRKEFVYG